MPLDDETSAARSISVTMSVPSTSWSRSTGAGWSVDHEGARASFGQLRRRSAQERREVGASTAGSVHATGATVGRR